jgi:hypothetical protein
MTLVDQIEQSIKIARGESGYDPANFYRDAAHAAKSKCFAYIREQAGTLVGDGGSVFFKAYDSWVFTAMIDQIERTDNVTK